jgi:DNA-directed RNA polymerase subunit RPC12/RpoP
MREKIVYFCGFCGTETDRREVNCTKCGSKEPYREWRKIVADNARKKKSVA